MKRRGTAAALLAAASCLMVLIAVRCGDNENSPLLDPQAGITLAEGVISGVLDYGRPGPYPSTIVIAIPYYDPSCSGGYSSIHVTGEYNNWDEGAWETAPGMTELFPCLWRERITLAAADDQFEWKFVTDKSWPSSYAAGGGTVDETARRGPTTDENGDNLIVSIPAAGDYWFMLNSSTDPAYFWIADQDEPLWDSLAADSTRFTIENLEASVYTVIIWVIGDEVNFPVRYIRGVRVSGDKGTDLGVVEVVPSGEIFGVVAFDDAPATRPAVTVFVDYSDGGAVDTVTIASADSVFTVGGLNDDTYDLRFHAPGYVDTVVEAVDFSAERDTDLGRIVLVRGGAASGTVEFQDDPSNPPSVIITGVRASDDMRIATTVADPATGLYVLDGLPAGLVDLEFTARKYRDTTMVDVSIAVGETTAVGLVTLAPGCVSVATTIHVLGEFNGWSEALFTSDAGMDQVESCLWRDTIDVPPSVLPEPEFKFVTDGNYTTPPDYVLCDGEEYDSLGGPVCLLGEGSPPNLVLTDADTPGRYQFTLDEDSLVYRAKILEEFTATIGGTIAYDSGLEPPFPAITVSATKDGGATAFASVSVNPSTGVFTLRGLDAGTYAVAIDGSNMRDTTLAGLVVTAGGTLDLGTITVTEITCQSEFYRIQVVGDFTGWGTPPQGPDMTEIEPCTWVVNIEIDEGCHLFKFVTNGSYDNPPSYGCCDGETECDPGTSMSGDVCLGSGQGTAIGYINFTSSGTYEFRLDEGNLTYAITKLE
ncbi:MAG: hypothetical protein JW958_14155 [Candidatus Eisenbacteria bacterium]|nr:hypothetical protein [Candidatus Eisenbacteria bacterium]